MNGKSSDIAPFSKRFLLNFVVVKTSPFSICLEMFTSRQSMREFGRTANRRSLPLLLCGLLSNLLCAATITGRKNRFALNLQYMQILCKFTRWNWQPLRSHFGNYTNLQYHCPDICTDANV